MAGQAYTMVEETLTENAMMEMGFNYRTLILYDISYLYMPGQLLFQKNLN